MKHFVLRLSNNFGDDFSGDDVLPGLVYVTMLSPSFLNISASTLTRFTIE